MPKLLRLFLRGAAFGAVVAIIAVLGLLFFTDGRLARLVFQSEGGWIGLVVLTFQLCLTFGGAQIAFSVLMLKGDEDE